MDTVAAKVSRETKARAAIVAKRRGMSLSSLVREALENEIKNAKPKTWSERFHSLQGAVKGTPQNLSEIEGFD